MRGQSAPIASSTTRQICPGSEASERRPRLPGGSANLSGVSPKAPQAAKKTPTSTREGSTRAGLEKSSTAENYWTF
jgi:hypothetical protein